MLNYLAIILAATVVQGSTWLSSESELDGQQLYQRRCAACHGKDGTGNGPDASIVSEAPSNLREGLIDRYPTDDLVRRVRESAPLPLELDITALRVRTREVESLVAYLNQLPTIRWDLVATGWNLYASRCETCHDHYGRPVTPLPPGVHSPRDLSTSEFQHSLTQNALAQSVRHGRKGMPALTPRVPETAAKPLAAYVRLLSPGFESYSRYCAHCHGDDGLGADAPLGSIGIPDVKFDRAYFAKADPEKLRLSVWHMLAEQKPSMPHFGFLISDAQARAIVEYLKQLGSEKSH